MTELSHSHGLLTEAADLAAQEAVNFDGLVDDILTRVVIETLKTYQKKLSVGLEDSITDLLANFKEQVSQAVFASSTGWRVVQRDAFLFPRGCRFCFSRGNSTLFVIEQDPQVRSLLLDACLTGDSRVSHHDVDPIAQAARYALALPYVVFIAHFRNGVYCGLYCGWRLTPLRGLEDNLLRPALPNIHANLNVCMGRVSGAAGQNCCVQIENALDHFWNSRFNSDLSDAWWVKGRIHPSLRTPRTWAEASANNPLFVLSLPFEHTDFTVNKILQLLTVHEQEPDETSLHRQLTENIDQCVDRLSARVMRYFKKTKFERFYPKDIKQSVAAILDQSSSELKETIEAIRHELKKLESEVTTSKSKKFVPQSNFWSDYSA